MQCKKLMVLFISMITLNACSTAPKSVLMGAAAGGTLGAAMGQSQSHNSGGTAVGALVGAGLGSLIGYLAYSDKQKKKNEIKNSQSKTVEEQIPFLTKPKIRSYIVPDTIDGNKYIKSHRVFILESPGEWSKD